MSLPRLVEVHRLAVAGEQARIARAVGDRVGRVWLAGSRFADVAGLAELTLSLGEDAGAFYEARCLGSNAVLTARPSSSMACDPQSLLAPRLGAHGFANVMTIEAVLRRRLDTRIDLASVEEMEQVSHALRAAQDL
jgi:hypothetical protein